MKILLLDKDADYSQRLKYFFEKKYHDMQISICDNIEAVDNVLENESIEIVLFDAEFDDVSELKIDEIAKNSVFSYISSTNEIVNNRDTIYKYKSISELYSKLCELYEKRKNRIIRQTSGDDAEKKDTEVITFMPVHGGAGSSTIAAACAVALAKENKVLYLNFEQRTSVQVFFRGAVKSGLSDLVAALKTKYTENTIYQLLKEVIQQDTVQQFARPMFVNGYKNIMDCLSINPQCVEVILNVLKKRFDFRYIIIDTDFIVSDVMQKLIVSSDKLVFVSSGSDISNIKLTKLARYIDIVTRENENVIGDKYLIMNQYYGSVNSVPSMQDMKVIGSLARYRTDEVGRVSSQAIIDQILQKDNFFNELL